MKRTICAVAIALALLIMPALSLAEQAPTGGSGPASGPLFVEPSIGNRAMVGKPFSAAGDGAQPGESVYLHVRRNSGKWQKAATATAEANGAFNFSWSARRSGKYRLRFTSQSVASAAVTPTREHVVTVFTKALATWYGPGLYGNRMACGKRLTKQTLGVAHRTLPCGSKVAISYGGKTVTTRVIDRGPFAAGIDWDLTAATAQMLGMTSTAEIAFASLH